MGKAARDKKQGHDASATDKAAKPQKPWWQEMLSVLLMAVVMAAVLKCCIVDSRRIPSSSMLPTIEIGDRVVLWRLAYLGQNEPQRGDIVVFRPPAELGESKDMIKRVIGLPGETVSIHDGLVYINDAPLSESYLAESMVYEFGPYEVPQDSYFVLGDNRNYSHDAHLWPSHGVSADNIKGKAVWRYWPLSRFGAIDDENPGY